MTEQELPKQELLIKLLALTASDSEGEALSAMRKANSLLATAGWTWEKLIRGKIRVIADPFVNLKTPEPRQPTATQMTTPSRESLLHPTTTARPKPFPQPRPQPSSPSWASINRTAKAARKGKIEPSLSEL